MMLHLKNSMGQAKLKVPGRLSSCKIKGLVFVLPWVFPKLFTLMILIKYQY